MNISLTFEHCGKENPYDNETYPGKFGNLKIKVLRLISILANFPSYIAILVLVVDKEVDEKVDEEID